MKQVKLLCSYNSFYRNSRHKSPGRLLANSTSWNLLRHAGSLSRSLSYLSILRLKHQTGFSFQHFQERLREMLLTIWHKRPRYCLQRGCKRSVAWMCLRSLQSGEENFIQYEPLWMKNYLCLIINICILQHCLVWCVQWWTVTQESRLNLTIVMANWTEPLLFVPHCSMHNVRRAEDRQHTHTDGWQSRRNSIGSPEIVSKGDSYYVMLFWDFLSHKYLSLFRYFLIQWWH